MEDIVSVMPSLVAGIILDSYTSNVTHVDYIRVDIGLTILRKN